jgi:Holliday junction resolvase RusA-like endonuclease
MAELVAQFNLKPFPKERPRATRAGVMYTPRKTRDYEKQILELFKEQFPDHEPIVDPICVKVDVATESVIVSVYKRDHKPKGMRGDLDNYVKAILDALNGAAWEDDRQIVALTARKVGP